MIYNKNIKKLIKKLIYNQHNNFILYINKSKIYYILCLIHIISLNINILNMHNILISSKYYYLKESSQPKHHLYYQLLDNGVLPINLNIIEYSLSYFSWQLVENKSVNL